MPPSEGSDPSASVCVMVHSRSWHDSCSVLVSSKTGKVQCNKGCTNWATYSMCSHTLAAAEEMGVLKEFLKWFKSKKRSPNLSATSDQGKEGRLPVCDRDLQSSFAPVSHEIPSCTYVSDQSTPPWPLFSQFSQIQPSPGFIIPEASQLINNYPCPQRESQQGKENMPPTYPQRSKPAPDILVFARLPFLDARLHDIMAVTTP